MVTTTSALRHARDIRSVFATGSVAHGRTIVLHARDRGDRGAARWTVVAGRKVGGAVRRNRAKRRLRAVAAAAPAPDGFDLVVVARPSAVMAPFASMVEEFETLLARVRQAATHRQGVAS